LVAVTVKVYDLVSSRPVTTMGEPAPLAVIPLGVEVTVYEVMGLPPLSAGATKDTVACPLPATATTAVGAPGTVWARRSADADMTPSSVVTISRWRHEEPRVVTPPSSTDTGPPWADTY
jgi:hypothetical protein